MSVGTGTSSDAPLRKAVAFGSDVDSPRNQNEKHETVFIIFFTLFHLIAAHNIYLLS
jgi:hypothetical protein